MMRIALTGSIGMGKSTVAKMFERAGVPVFDADAVVRELQGEGGALVQAIGRRFPGTVHDGLLDRDRLSKLVLDKPPELAALEAMVHPEVQRARERFIAAHRKRQRSCSIFRFSSKPAAGDIRQGYRGLGSARGAARTRTEAARNDTRKPGVHPRPPDAG